MTDIRALQDSGESARLFRRILDGISRPGTPVDMPAIEGVPAPLHASAAAVLLSLCDYQTPVWLSGAVASEGAKRFVRFHTGAPLTDNRTAAVFAVMAMDEAASGWDAFSLGTHEYPDRSATLIIQCDGFSEGAAAELSGPGLKEAVQCQIDGASAALWLAIQRNNALFPLGLDFVFAAPGALVWIPRSTRIAVPGGA